MSTSAYIDAQATNLSKRSARVYKDLNLNFLAHPVKKDIQRLYDIESVKRSVRNLVNLNKFVYEPRIDLSSVIVTDNSDRNEYIITIEFFVINTPAELVTLETILQRAR
jgi:hypothetical protein